MERSGRVAWLFLAPSLIVLGLFTFYPFIYGIWLAFCDWSLLAHDAQGRLLAPRFVGMANFVEMSHDRYFHIALLNSVRYLLVVPVLQLLAMALAVVLNQRLRGLTFIRAAMYVPVITSVVVVGIAWHWVYQSDGLLNTLLVDVLGVLPRRVG